jgi:hypothetical protein
MIGRHINETQSQEFSASPDDYTYCRDSVVPAQMYSGLREGCIGATSHRYVHVLVLVASLPPFRSGARRCDRRLLHQAARARAQGGERADTHAHDRVCLVRRGTPPAQAAADSPRRGVGHEARLLPSTHFPLFCCRRAVRKHEARSWSWPLPSRAPGRAACQPWRAAAQGARQAAAREVRRAAGPAVPAAARGARRDGPVARRKSPMRPRRWTRRRWSCSCATVLTS